MLVIRSKVKVTWSKFKKNLEDSKSGALDPSGLNSRKSRKKGMGPGPKWFDSRSPEKKIKRGHCTLVVEIPGNPEEQDGAQPKWLNPEIRKSLMGTGPRD